MVAKSKPRKRREDCFLGLHFDLHPSDKDTQLGRFVTPEMVKKILRAARPDYIQYDCKGHVGYLGYPASKVSASAGGPEGKGIVNDSLAIYRQATAEAGVALLVHFSGVWDNVALKDHPEWAALQPDGKPDENATSTFSPYVTERMIPQLKEVVDRYQVDGFWVDGDCWSTVVDYGPAAREKFKQLTGQDNPPTKPGEPFWYEWMTIQRDQFFAYLKTYMGALHEYAPGIQIASNWLYSPLCPEPVKAPVDFISGDYAHSDSLNSARFNGRQLANVGLPWDLLAWAFSISPDGPFIYKPAEQLMQEAAAVLALGGGFGMYFSPDRHGGFPDWQIKLMGQVADFCHARKEVCFKSQPVPQVALLLDTTTLFKISPRVYAPYFGEYDGLQGMLHATLESGHAADILADHQLPGQLDRWPVMIVPEWDLLPVGLVNELAEYARRGGSLLLTGAKTCALFREHLGVEFKGETPLSERFLQIPGRTLTNAAWAAPLKGIWQEIALPSGGTKEAVKVLALRSDDRAGRQGATPAATLSRLGKGRIAAFYGPLGYNYRLAHVPKLRDWIGSLLGRLYQPRVTIDQHHLDLAVREKDGRLIVHLVNTSAMATTPAPYPTVERIPPVGPVRVTIRLPGKPRRVRLEPGGKRLSGQWSRGTLTVRLPSIAIHSAIVVE